MSDIHDPAGAPQPGERPPVVIPLPDYSRRPPPPPYTSPIVLAFRWLFRMAFMLSIGLNFFLFFILLGHTASSGVGTLFERYHSGNKDSKDKVAVIKVDGVIMEGMMAFANKQVEEAASDDNVKAIVLRIISPGGSITASDEFHRRLSELRDGTTPGKPSSPKPLVVSMGALAASGGYYIAMPAKTLVAERTTITGSIGVYAAFPNISGLAKEYGFGMTVIKAGEVKDSGSMFKQMKPEERYLWQEMVDHAFDQFVGVVEEGRPALKGKMREVVVDKQVTVKDDEDKPEKARYVRRRADGGIYTAKQAQELGLIDQIGYLEDAITEAAKTAGLGSDYKAVVYERPATLAELFLKSQAQGNVQFDLSKLAEAACPRLWYLAPQNELSGHLSILRRE